MKKQSYIHLLTLLFLSARVFSQEKQQLVIRDSIFHIAAKQPASLWGEINLGYSNDGVMGDLTLKYRKGNLFFGAAYYKSHICYDDNKKRDYFLDTDNSQNHKTVESLALFSGIVFPGKCTPALSIGISWLQFNYITTIPVDENVTVERIWETIAGSDYNNEVVGAKTITTVGIPVSLSLHFRPKHFTGMNTAVNTNLNTHRVLFSVSIGIDLGRVVSRRPG